VFKPIQKFTHTGPILTSKILSHRPPGPAFGRPEDRLRPVPMAEQGPGLRWKTKRGIALNHPNASKH
jgi:hypothetical protein